MMEATAAVAVSPDAPFEFRKVALEEPRDDEVLVRIVGSGICHTDVAVKEQSVELPLPMVLGHEGSGVVEAVGSSVRNVAPGDHVVLSGDSCGICHKCHAGLPSYCDDFVERNLTGLRTDRSSPMSADDASLRGRFCGQSSFATHSVAPARSVIKVDADLPLELLGPLGCGLTTGVGTVMNALRPRPGASVAVFGVGTVGLSAVLGAVLSGCETIIAVDRHEARLAMATELGATHCLTVGDGVAETIVELTHGGADFSVECSGSAAAIAQAIACLGRPGWCAQVGAPPAGTTVPLDIGHVGYGRGIRGVVLGEASPQSFVPYLASLYRAGRLPFDRFVKYYDFADIDQAIEDSSGTGEVIKPILKM